MSSQMEQPIVTVRKTFDENVRFIVPDYQRGYKWTVAEVRKLLEDVDSFTPGNGLEYYCLQNLTLVSSIRDQDLRVVDGQQRLTTSSIIMSYLRHRGIENLPKLRNGITSQLSFGERKKATTQPFFVSKILEGGIWKDVEGRNIVGDDVWMSSQCTGELSETLHAHFKTWLRLCPEANYDHSDIFHMFCAAMTVAAFFEANDKVKKPIDPCYFAAKFLDEVRFLHNIVTEDPTARANGKEDTGVLEAEIFSKINGFRVPLDGADLLRAIFITYAVNGNAIGGGFTEHEVRLNEARVKLGLELDEMGAWWHDKRHQKYFAMFDPYKGQETSFDSGRYPINILYRLFAAANGAEFITIDWFENYDAGIPKLYCDIRRFHSVLKDWYEDIKLYHYAGFLVGQCNAVFARADPSYFKCGVYNLFDGRFPTRSIFYRKLKERIFNAVTRLKDNDEEEEADCEKKWTPQESFSRKLTALKKAIDGSYDWYGDNSVEKVLTLMDVIAFAEPDCLQEEDPKEVKRNRKQEKMRTPLADHLDPEFFKCTGEDREHIFPQTPIGGKDKRSPKDFQKKMKDYWDLVCSEASKTSESLTKEWKDYWVASEALMKVSDEPFPLTFDSVQESEYWLSWLFADKDREVETIRRINEFVMYKCDIELNSIGNIVMLDAGINRGYGNKFFTEKRKEIWSKYRACQPVRLHTYRVFAKEFSGDTLGLDVWGKSSIMANRKAIKNGVEKFFRELFVKTEGVP